MIDLPDKNNKVTFRFKFVKIKDYIFYNAVKQPNNTLFKRIQFVSPCFA